MLVIYSDGVTEAVSPTGEEFGPTRLYEVVSRNVDASAAGIRDRIESSLTKFAQGTSAADDITLVIVKRQTKDKTCGGDASLCPLLPVLTTVSTEIQRPTCERTS